MLTLSSIGRLLERRSRMKSYKAVRNEMEALSDNELADMGLKRYQLGHAARTKALPKAW